MPISIQCPACQAKLNAPDTSVGKRVKCPKCQGAIAIPGAVPATAAAPPAARRPAAPKASSPQPEPTRAAKPAAAAAPVGSAPQVVVPAASAPVPAGAPPVAAPAKSGLPVMLIVLGIAILGGGVLLVSALGMGAYVLMASGEPAGPPAGPVAAVAGGLPAPPPIDSPPTPAPTPVQAEPQPPAAASVNWVAYENAEKGFQAAFPGSQPQPIDPLAEIQDESQRELVAAAMREWTVLGVVHAGRKYTLTAAPIDLGGAPPSAYLDRMSAGLGLIHQGFSLDPQPPVDRSVPVRDYVLKKEDAGKLLRVVVGGGHIYQLLIEGEAGLTFSDVAAKSFFDHFECEGVSSPAVATASSDQPPSKAKSKTKRRPDTTANAEPDGIDWQPLQGKRSAFTISFPGVTPKEEDPLAPVPESARAKLQKSWTDFNIAAESYVAQAGDRRYAITVFHSSQPPRPGSNFTGQLDSIGRTYTMEIYNKIRGRGFSTGAPKVQWQQWTTTSQSIRGERKVVIRRAVLGPYAFVARVEGPAMMDDDDPQVLKFFDGLMPPADAALQSQ